MDKPNTNSGQNNSGHVPPYGGRDESLSRDEKQMVRKHPPAYLSASRLGCCEWCPAEFYKRYVLKQDQPPDAARLFGVSVHKGIEAHFKGQDDELTYLAEWRRSTKELSAAGIPFQGWLTGRGLELLEMVRGLELHGESERRIGVIHPDIPLPFIGYTDLWSEGHIWDFKTTGYAWTQAKADRQIFQPAIYSQAHSDEYSSIPTFTFVVLPRAAGSMQLLDGTRTGDQIIAAFEKAKEIYELIEAQVFDCTCGKHELGEAA